jgi:Tol biopolymer transport system component
MVPITSWTPDSLRLTFNRGSQDSAATTLEWQSADAATPAEVLYQSPGSLVPGSWTGDGKALMILSADGNARDLWVLQRSAGNKAAPWQVTAAFERAPALSPNGRWVAYVSDESGQDQVYLQSYPSPGTRHTVSTDGGTEPVWARDGRELYYRTGDKMLAVAVGYSPALTLGQTRVLFESPYGRDLSTARGLPNYDVAADGRFLMIAPLSPQRVVVVLNWDQELKVPER